MTLDVESTYKIVREGLVDKDAINNGILSKLSLRKGYLGILTDASISLILI